MNFDLVFLFIVGLFIAYTLFDCQTNESMADTSTSTIDAIQNAVKQVYLADVQAIRNLSNVATQLQTGGVTIPGNLITSGKFATNGLDPNNMPNGWDGGIRGYDAYFGGSIGAGPDGKQILASMNRNGDITGKTLTTSGLLTAGNVILNTGIQGPNGQLRISNQGIMFGGPNTDRELNSGQISAGIHIPDSLNIVGISKDKGVYSRRIDMWAEGGLNVYGNVFPKKNRARFIRVGNTDASLRKDYWTLIEFKAYDHDGNNVALGKPVKILEGKPANSSNNLPGNITNGVVFNTPTVLHDNYLNGYHGDTGINVLEIDLGGEINLAQIVLFNRWNGSYAERMDGTTVEFIDAYGQRNRIIYTGTWYTEYSKEYLL